MRGLNKVMLIGNLGADPEIRYTQAGVAVANMRLATNFSFTDRSGEKREHTEWHRVVVFGKLAEIVSEYLNKGDPVYFEGRLRTRKWQSQDGQDRYSTEVIASDINLLGGGTANQASDTATYAPAADIDDDDPIPS